jgi:N-acetylneuraminate synthase
VSPSIIAATLGARVIERHITLDRAMYGSDQSASLEFPGIQRLVGSLRKFPIIYGNKEKIISDRERIVAKKLRYWEND